MIFEPVVLVGCDTCKDVAEFSMIAVAGGLFKPDDTEALATAQGWIVRDGGETTFCCKDCEDVYEADRLCAEQERRDSGR